MGVAWVENQPDLIVIGGGSAGCAVAARLTEAGKRVLLVEAGKSEKDLKLTVPALMSGVVHKPDFDWCYLAEPDPSIGGRPDVWPAGKRLGGGSSINGMMFIRGHKWDYDHWAELGATGWDWQSCLPYFKRLEDNERGADEWRGTGGPISVSECRSRYQITDDWIEAAVAAGVPRSPDLNGELAEGVDHIQLSQRGGLRCSTAVGYLRRLTGNPNLAVMLEAEVLRLESAAGRITGVRVRHNGQERLLTSNEGVVLSAGALNTPRLLMLSGIGHGAHLREMGVDVTHDLPGVGQNLQEHPGVHLVNEVRAHTLNDDSRGVQGAMQVLKLLFGRSGALTTGIGHAQAFVHTRPGLPAPNIQIAFSAFSFEVTPQGNLALAKQSSTSSFVALMRPKHRGQVTLRGNDPALAPKIEYQLLGDDDDVAQLAEGLLLARKISESGPFVRKLLSEVRPGHALDTVEALVPYVRAATLPMYHPIGTARMGAADDPMAVVDPDLKLRGIDGLWIADASIMPTIPQGNTNATSIMIGDKAADHVLKALAG
jgi:choline dehydrogenase